MAAQHTAAEGGRSRGLHPTAHEQHDPQSQHTAQHAPLPPVLLHHALGPPPSSLLSDPSPLESAQPTCPHPLPAPLTPLFNTTPLSPSPNAPPTCSAVGRALGLYAMHICPSFLRGEYMAEGHSRDRVPGGGGRGRKGGRGIRDQGSGIKVRRVAGGGPSATHHLHPSPFRHTSTASPPTRHINVYTWTGGKINHPRGPPVCFPYTTWARRMPAYGTWRVHICATQAQPPQHMAHKLRL